MKMKQVEVVVPPREPHYVGDGFRVHNFIPQAYRMDMERMDPFLMLDYNSKYDFPGTEHPKGVGAHPHKGFETVTIAYKGSVAHADSAGNAGVLKEGGVQWMTAGSGILHKEFHEENFSRKGGTFQMVQLWVNLPAKHKNTKPQYQDLQPENIPVINLPDAAGTAAVVAGSYLGQQGAAKTFTPIHLYNVQLQAGKQAAFDFPENYATGLLVIEGSIQVNGGELVPTDHFVLMDTVGTHFTIEASENALVLVLSGEPIRENVVAHGPFVMNTREEIVEAFREFNTGKFGYLE
jgi:redox-sensitive bicupin YhaK (pirin superfamily)